MEEDSLVKKEDNLNQNGVQDNNQTMNNEQVNDVKEPKKGNGFIVGLLLIIIVGIAGYFVYDKFIKKEEPSKENNTEEKGNNEQNNTPTPSSNLNDYSNLAGREFKNSNGTKVLKIVSKDDRETLDKVSEYEEWKDYPYDYLAYYNNRIFSITGDVNEYLKYFSLGALEIKDGIGQWPWSNDFIINKETGMLLDLNYDSNYKIHKVGNKYYFSEGGIAYGFSSASVYNEELKRIGSHFFDGDSNGNIYILDNDYIIKYDENNNVLKKSDIKYDFDINEYSLAYDDTLYIIAKVGDSSYLIDVMNNQRYKLSNEYTDAFHTIDGVDGYTIVLKNDNKLIKIVRGDKEYGEEEELLYTFNPSTKELTKAN